jgi:hypothetical protein
LKDAVAYAWEVYGEAKLGSGERIWSHALGMAVIIAGLGSMPIRAWRRCSFAIPMTNMASRGSRNASASRRPTWSWHFAAQPPAADHQGLRRGQHRGR